MPPQVNFSKEVILTEAFNLARQEGFQFLKARRIAQRLNCSTRPIYSAFTSMKDLEEAVIQKAAEYLQEYLLVETHPEYPFLNIGLRYIQFAKEERELFKLIYLSDRTSALNLHFNPSFELFMTRMKHESLLQSFDEQRLKRLLTDMWIFTHGLIMISFAQADADLPVTEEFAIQRLLQMGRTLIEWEHLDQRRSSDPRVNELGILNLADNAPRIRGGLSNYE